LVNSLLELQIFDPVSTGWNDSNSAYFIAGNSEYSLDQPLVNQGTFPLTNTVRQDYNAFFDSILAALPNLNLSTDQVQAITTTISRWRSALDAQSELPSLTINAQIDHINNNNMDDHCALQVTVVWLAEINMYLPVTYGTAYTWGVDVLAVISSGDISNALTAQTIMSIGVEKIGLGMAFDPEGVLASILTTLAFDVYLATIHAIDKASDDGGKAYFPAVVSQCFARLLDAVVSPASVATTSVPLPSAGSIGQMWTANYSSSSILEDTDYPWYSTQINVQNNFRYNINLPELGWLPFGGGLLLTFKVDVLNHTNGYAAVMMMLSNDGTLFGCSAALQLGDDDTIVDAPTVWRSNQTNDQLIDDFTGTLSVQAYTSDGAEIYLPTLLNSVMKNAINNLARQTSPWSSIGHSPLPMINTLQTNEYDYGSRPKIAITPAGTALELHTNGNDGIFRDILDVSGSSVQPLKLVGAYQDGEDPSAAVLSDGVTIVEVHGGYNKNKMYYNIMTLNGQTLTSVTSSGSDYDKGENPCVAASCVNGVDRIFEVHRDASATSIKLYYNTATWNGSSLTWNDEGSNRQYDSGEYPTIAFATNQTTLIEAHATKPINTIFDGGNVIDSIIWVRAGTTTASSVSFSNSSNIMSGTTPTLAVRTGDTVVIFASLNGYLVYSIGKLNGTYIQWTICGQRWAKGQRPGLGRRSDNKLILVYENTAVSGGQMYGALLDLNVPPGFNVA
ncbi:MAG: hypothetical protein VXW65_03230, partial [Pseudomonadota bacterium]|nr:hypothetical protein [Pseudomonadota bacterium]